MDNGGSLSRLWHDARIFTFFPRRSSRRATFSSLVLVSADRIRDRFIQKKSENRQTLLQSQPVGDIDTFSTSGLWRSALASFPT